MRTMQGTVETWMDMGQKRDGVDTERIPKRLREVGERSANPGQNQSSNHIRRS